MNKIYGIIVAIIVGCIGGYFAAGIVMWLFDYDDGIVVTYIICSLLIAVITYFVVGYKLRCVYCRRLFANYEISKEEIDRRETTMVIKNTRRDKYGRVIDYFDETVPAIEIIYLCKDRCAYCGQISQVHRSQKVKK